MKYNIPAVGEIELDTLVLDLNGTIALRGQLVEGVAERIEKLKNLGFKIYLFSGDQRGNAAKICEDLGIELKVAKTGDEKKAHMHGLNKATTAAIGNARIDIPTFENSALAIATLQAEGIHAEILKHVDLILPSINDALDLLLDQDAFAATMRV